MRRRRTSKPSYSTTITRTPVTSLPSSAHPSRSLCAAVKVILLRFLTRAITAAEPTWKLSVVSTAVGALAAYLISNGFTALNVQLRPRGIDSVISAVDLSVVFNQSLPGLTTNATHSYPETQLRNPITNTILRNAVLPRVLSRAYCTGGVNESVPTTAVEFGFMPREWQSRLLTEALPAQQIRVVVTPTNATLQDGATSADMPMNASTASDLFLYGMFLMVDQFKTGRNFVNTTEIRAHYPLFSVSPFARLDYPKYANISLAKLLMVLPPDDQGIKEEVAQRDYFLKKSTSGLRSHFAAVVNTSTSEFNMTFSHVQVADNIKFESITFDFEVDPMMMANTSNKGNATRFTDVSMVACAATPGTCLMQKALYGNDDYQYDPPAQIQAFGQCLNDVGTPELRAYWFTGQYPDSLECSGPSNTSFLVFSVGKRVTAAVFTANHTAQYGNIDSKTSGLRYSENDHVATNVRKFFTVTIGRLSWEWKDLASEFGATCDDSGAAFPCIGLQLPLVNSTAASAEQRLITGADSLSIATLSPLRSALTGGVSRPLALALVREPPPPRAKSKYLPGGDRREILAGDPLLPHNIQQHNWTDIFTPVMEHLCYEQVEDRISLTLNYHLYNEHGLQPAYTAAVFFLFENAVVRDVVPLNSTTTTLDFTHNVRHIAVWLSVPDQSAWLTLAGCVLLMVGLAAAMLQSETLSKTKSDSLSNITEPHVIARVMLDEGQFPPLLLHRHIITKEASEGNETHRKVDRFAIDSLGLKDQQNEDRLAAVA